MNELAELISTGASLVERYPDARTLASPLQRFQRPITNTWTQALPEVVGRLPPPGPRESSRPARVCIGTSDLAGPVRNGGVGTACTLLAEALADAGHDVTILYVGPFEAGDASHWREHYRARRITFDVPGPSPVPLGNTIHARASYLAYDWLKGQPAFDVIHFPEINGVGFYTLQARRLGLAFHQAYIYVVLHSPTLWHRTENREHIDREEDLVLDFIERESVAWADALVSPSRYLLSWAARWGFRFPRDVYVQPYLSPTGTRQPVSEAQPVTDLVFFGRLESRKGLELYCDALDILASRGALQGRTLTFLGKIGRVGLEDGASYIRRRTERFDVPVRLETSLGRAEALEYLRTRSALAVMPSLADNMPYAVLECLSFGIPFVSTTTGGIPEMVAAADHPAVLAAPEPPAVAGLLERAIREGASRARRSADPDVVRDEWVAWHERLTARPVAPPPTTPTAQPLVSVCIATRNRPQTLLPAIESICAQTYQRVELIVVDDASDQAEALALLDRLELEFAGRGWRVVRRLTKGLPASARNTAAAHAHGEYLLFMDDDNLARPREVETFVAAALHSGVPLLTCVFDHFRVDPAHGDAMAPTLRWLPLGPAVTLGVLSNKFGDTNMLVRRDTFLQLGGFDEDLEAAFVEDWIFLSRAALSGTDMAVVPEPLFWYRVWDRANGQRRPYRASQHRRLVPYLSGEPPHRRALTLFTAGLYDRVNALEESRDHGEARSKSLEARFARSQPLIAIGPEDAISVEPDHDLEVSATGDGILLRSVGTDPIALLPVCPPPFVHSIARIELSAAEPTSLQLFWSTRAVPHSSEDQSTVIRFPRGRHVRWAEIPAAEHVGRLRLDPSAEPGDYLLHSLEIRCEIDAQPRSQIAKAFWRKWVVRPRVSAALAERFRRGRQVLDIRDNAAAFTVMRGVRVAPTGNGIVLNCLDADPQLELSTLELTGQRLIARLDATSSAPTTSQMFWATRRRPYCEEQSAVIRLSPGRNSGYFVVPADARGRLRFDPASSACEVLMHSLELRTET